MHPSKEINVITLSVTETSPSQCTKQNCDNSLKVKEERFPKTTGKIQLVVCKIDVNFMNADLSKSDLFCHWLETSN